jgi:Tfp pilus assembly protein PilF
LPYAGLATVYPVLSGFGQITPEEAMPQSKKAAQMAVDLDETLAEAHFALAMVKWSFDWDWAGAESEFRQTIDISPAFPNAHNTYAHFLLAMGRPPEAIEESRRALELDPSDVYMNEDLAWVYMTAGRFEEATTQAHKTLAMDERAYGVYLILAWIAEKRGDFNTAIAEIERARSIEPNNSLVEMERGYALARAGRSREVKKILNSLKASREYISPYSLAILYAGLAEDDKALFYLNLAYGRRVNEMIALRMEWKFDHLRDDPRFQEILRKMNLM